MKKIVVTALALILLLGVSGTALAQEYSFDSILIQGDKSATELLESQGSREVFAAALMLELLMNDDSQAFQEAAKDEALTKIITFSDISGKLAMAAFAFEDGGISFHVAFAPLTGTIHVYTLPLLGRPGELEEDARTVGGLLIQETSFQNTLETAALILEILQAEE